MIECYLPNPGRMRELLIPGAKVVLREVAGTRRKTQHDLIAIYYGRTVVTIDSRVPNTLILEALKEGGLEEFTQYTRIKPEFTYGPSRIDFLLSNDVENCLLEVKSCTLVRKGIALFPDAPTVRGRRHLLTLMKSKTEGYRASVLFLVQRTDARLFSPNDSTDPYFCEALRKAASEGVEIYAYSSELQGNKLVLGRKIDIKLDNV
jgi:sugar fermentation stimulation protein A